MSHARQLTLIDATLGLVALCFFFFEVCTFLYSIVQESIRTATATTAT